jgi:hypothetical protein
VPVVNGNILGFIRFLDKHFYSYYFMKYLSLLQAVFNNSFSINLSPFVRQAIDAEDAEV